MRLLPNVLLFALSSAAGELDNDLFVFNSGVTRLQDAPKTPEARVALVKELGYAGIEGYGPATHGPLKAALTKAGLKMPCNYNKLELDPAKPPYDPGLKAMIANSSPGEAIWFHLHGKTFKDNPGAGDERAVTLLSELADYAAPYGVKLAAYPHKGNHCATVEHSVRLAKMVARPNVGAVINLCHLLAVEGADGIEEKIRMAAPYLIAASINGADAGNTRNMTWKQLIQPLGEGTFDAYAFVKTLKDAGYDGPIGLQCYNIQGTSRGVLTRSMNTWRAYQKRYAEDSKR